MRWPTIVAAIAGSLLAAQAWAASGPTFSLNADEAPSPKPWTEPASFSLSKDAGKKSAFVADVAGRLDWLETSDALQPSKQGVANTRFARLVAHRNNTVGEQVENYEIEAGLHREWRTGPAVSKDPHVYDEAFFLYQDVSLGLASKTTFDDEEKGCDVAPKPARCIRFRDKSARLKWRFQPYKSAYMERVPAWVAGKATDDSPLIGWSWTPLVTLFVDDVFDAKVDENGVKGKGVVSGAVVELKGALNPALFDYRFTLSASITQTQAFQREDKRKANFAANSTLSKVSLDLALGHRAFENTTGWAPSFGVSYIKGDDPLSGKLDKANTFIGVKITYRTPS